MPVGSAICDGTFVAPSLPAGGAAVLASFRPLVLSANTTPQTRPIGCRLQETVRHPHCRAYVSILTSSPSCLHRARPVSGISNASFQVLKGPTRLRFELLRAGASGIQVRSASKWIECFGTLWTLHTLARLSAQPAGRHGKRALPLLGAELPDALQNPDAETSGTTHSIAGRTEPWLSLR